VCTAAPTRLTESPSARYRADVLVVGGGAAGLSAAIEARAAGADDVIVLEAAGQPGGATRIATGSLMAAGTVVQRELGLDDDAQRFFDYYMAIARFQAPAGIVRELCDRASDALDWLAGLGVEFTSSSLYRAGVEHVPRSHRASGGGQAIVDALTAECRRRMVRLETGHRATRLLRDAVGSVRGAGGDGWEVRAAATVLATGGFAANHDLVRRYVGETDADWSPAPSTCTGDGIELGLSAGAAMAGAGHGDLLLTSASAHQLEAGRPAWLVLVDGSGHRFASETTPYPFLSACVQQLGGTCWAVNDAAVLADGCAPEAGSWSPASLRRGAADGTVLVADQIDQLAERMGVPPRQLTATIARYNTDCALGRDRSFEKGADGLRPVASPPFYAVRLSASVPAVTGYGVQIDRQARVLSAADLEPVPGLFAAGEVTGNVLGPQYVGYGIAITSAVVYGRIAGQQAAQPAR
jgi:fumarate reductase flavoprotein subunit